LSLHPRVAASRRSALRLPAFAGTLKPRVCVMVGRSAPLGRHSACAEPPAAPSGRYRWRPRRACQRACGTSAAARL